VINLQNVEPRGSVIELSDRQWAKDNSQITSSEEGRGIDVSPLRQNAARSIRDNFEFGANAIEASDLHSEKHDSQITSTEAGN
jgi:hypothetical protein